MHEAGSKRGFRRGFRRGLRGGFDTPVVPAQRGVRDAARGEVLLRHATPGDERQAGLLHAQPR